MKKESLTVKQYHRLTKKYDVDNSRLEGTTIKNLNFLSVIAPNYSNSCFIDSTFELLWNAVLPFVPIENIDCSENAFDDILVRSFRKYTADAVNMQEKKKFTLEASGLIRNFVWNIPNSVYTFLAAPQFPRGESNCVIELLEVFFKNMSSEFKLLISG